ncbi:hypothetical protein C4F50_00255 [Flavobacterium sp. KB82]|uniref:Phage protein n=2 Tax=Flavobacterium hungaricum TaxID=2082725 RepID=A0ABR9TDB8_9FLAO|nr:hypothetical protein [Flavobacterium hungaricum]
MNNTLDNFKIKVFNALKKKEQLQYLDYEVDLSKIQSKFNFSNGIYLGFDQKIYAYYSEEEALNNSTFGVKHYLNYETTLKYFDTIDDAFDYIEYLQNLLNSKQLEQFFYFEYKSKKWNQPLYKKFSLRIANNKSAEDYIVRIDSSGSDFYMTICFFANYQFKVDFMPVDENWSNHKVKKYNHIDDLFLDFQHYTSYDSISIEESERDLF